MIRIETTAEFDAQGRFTVSGQTTDPVPAGLHRVVLEVGQSPSADVFKASEEVDASTFLECHDGLMVCTSAICSGKHPNPLFIEKDGLVLLHAEPDETVPSVDIRTLIEADRDARMRHIMGFES